MKFLLPLFFLHLVSSEFDCESSTTFPNTCPELNCIYDEVYESRPTSCPCKTTIITVVSLPQNTLKYQLFQKICSQHHDRLQQLQITDAELQSIDGEIFEKYNKLKKVNLAGNRIKLADFSQKAREIVELDVSANEITTLNSEVFGNLMSLKVLNMSFNKVEEVGDSFRKSTELEELYLNDNKLKKIGNYEFNYLKKLRILNLGHNNIVSVQSFGLPNLKELYLNNNQLNSLQRGDFKNTPNLRILNIAHNFISHIEGRTVMPTQQNNQANFGNIFGDIGKSFTNQDNLKNPFTGFSNSNQNRGNLFFLPNQNQNGQIFNPYQTFGIPNSQNKPNDLKPRFFLTIGAPPFNNNNSSKGNLEVNPAEEQTSSTSPSISGTWMKLQDLNLAENRIRHFPEGFLDGLNELRNLNISYNELSQFDFSGLGPKLTFFDFSNNPLREIDLNMFKNRWSLLKIIDFDVNLIKCEDAEDVLSYFKDNRIVLRSCGRGSGCCGRILS